MKLWADFYSYYLNDVPECTYVTAENALRMAAQEFCDRSKVWLVILDPITTANGIQVYDFDLDRAQEISKVMEVKRAGQVVPVLLADSMKTQRNGLIALNQREFFVQPAPGAGEQIVIKAFLKPSNIATGVEDFIYAEHARTIAAGAKAELFSMTNQPFSNPQAAAYERSKFDSMVADATIKAAKAYSSAPLRTRASFM